MIYPSIDLYNAMVFEAERQRQKKLNEYYRQAAAQGQPKDKLGPKMAQWFGTKMIAWGSKLQSISTASPADTVVNPKLS